MPTNLSLNKVRVTSLFGSDDTLGMIDPQVNMLVRFGGAQNYRWITSCDAGNGQVSLAMASGGTPIAKAYPHQLYIDSPTASGWGWPSYSGDVVFGHHGIFPNGISQAVGSGMVYLGGGASGQALFPNDINIHVFNRTLPDEKNYTLDD